MAKVSKESAVSYMPGMDPVKGGKFYLGAKNIEKGADFTHADQYYTPLAKYDATRKLGDGQIEFIDEGVTMVREAERAIRSGNIDETSLSNITVIQLLREVIRREYRKFFAIEGTRRVPVPKLQLDVPITDKYAASKKVPEFVEPDQKTNKFTVANLRLWKNMVSIYESDEAQLKADIQPLNFEIDQAAGALGLAANDQIVTEIETFTTNGEADWGAMTTNADFSANNPLDDIQAVITTITGNHFRPDVIALHTRPLSDFLSNTFVNGYATAMDRTIESGFPLPKVPQLKVVQDIGFTNTVATVYDSNTLLLGEGPTTAEAFRNPLQSADGWVIRQWLHPLKTTNDAGRKMTSVSA
ncbi:hypothetical protein LCGC14_1346340 [marine sediment metagenome]|uniref:Major capsid protein n=1 Tax=marine sediment metagenome TaxID=412755 RepID=A0A0F9NEK6_9ZZZZ